MKENVDEDKRGIISGVQNGVSSLNYLGRFCRYKVTRVVLKRVIILIPDYNIYLQMNSLMDSIKYTLVISLPEDETFGYLIIASFCSICFGALLYTSYAVKMIRKKSTTNLKS